MEPILVPGDSLIREQWGAQITWPDGLVEDWWAGTRQEADKWVWYHDGNYSVCTSQLIRRYHITTPGEIVTDPPRRGRIGVVKQEKTIGRTTRGR